MSDASSAGSHRLTSGQDVLRRVDVPVMPGAARRAGPLPGAQAQLLEPVPARRAGLGGGVPPVDHDQVPAGPLALVGELAAELAPAAVADRAGQVPVADHAGDVQVLDDDHVRRADQAGAGAVQVVLPRVADLAVGAGYLRRGLGSVRGAFPAAGQAPLVAGQVPGLARQVPRVGDLLPVRGDGQVCHAQVDADRVPGRLQRLRSGGVDGKGHVPAAVRVPGHDHHRGVHRGHVHVWPGPGEPQRAGRLGQPQLPGVQGEGTAGVVGALAAAAGLEPRVTGAPGDERGERFVLVAEHLLQRHTGDLAEEGQGRVLLHEGQRGIGLGVGGARPLGLPAGLPGGQGPVPHHADAAEGAVQHLLLHLVGVRPAPVGCPHRYSIEHMVVRVREARRTCCPLVLLHRVAGHRIPPRPEGRGILRRSW